MINLVKVKFCNVSGKDKLPDKTIDKLKTSLHDHLAPI